MPYFILLAKLRQPQITCLRWICTAAAHKISMLFYLKLLYRTGDKWTGNLQRHFSRWMKRYYDLGGLFSFQRFCSNARGFFSAPSFRTVRQCIKASLESKHHGKVVPWINANGGRAEKRDLNRDRTSVCAWFDPRCPQLIAYHRFRGYSKECSASTKGEESWKRMSGAKLLPIPPPFIFICNFKLFCTSVFHDFQSFKSTLYI